ncbi:LPD1 domain-containing protein [Pandoraea cepalis]|uniref:Large polyvalent protein-associated domain-containing protein n=1 Tax=Pandoraea cepalis TaxID=2508294 RepID=A0A5E4VZR2_9BURK|nr:LPD1 domain-containing protein [Pandoraea cepalis]VVE18117.1 hypothetical protein PCE31107_03004 [Pandoraea cepalis]
MNQATIATSSDPRQLSLLSAEPPKRVPLELNDPKSANYRYADTGYIAGSRKEEAASKVILRAKKEGLRVHARTIDWDDLESNPREAKALITKSNLFGAVDWDSLRAAGLEPGAGYLIDRVYAAIGNEPDQDAPQARKDYTFGLQMLRDRLEVCKKVDDVLAALAEFREEFDGIKLVQQEADEIRILMARREELGEQRAELQRVSDEAYKAYQEASANYLVVDREVERRNRRGWKVAPELDARWKSAKAVEKARQDEWVSLCQEGKDGRRRGIDEQLTAIRRQAEAVYARAKARNLIESRFHRALNLMGGRLVKVLWYRSAVKGSEAFAKHVAAARTGLVADWSWAETSVSRAPRVTKESVRFQFKVADRYARVGGRNVIPGSTAELKEMFGLRDVQSGNWVLRDVVSGKFHTEQTATAFADLADLMGIADRDISHGGRLAVAFGARGKGATGAKGGAPMAHYELIHRVVNVTKEKGGGALGHEWFHALDNLIVEIVTGKPGSLEFATANPEMLPAGGLRNAFRELRVAMTSGNHQATQILTYTSEDVNLASRNVRPSSATKIARLIRDASNLGEALQGLEQVFGLQPGQVPAGRSKSNYLGWRRIAIAHHGGNPDGGEIEVRCGPKMSSFMAEAVKLDGKGKPYFTEIYEMAARAFQAWIEDRLAEQGRRNDYLSVFADNKFHIDALTGIEWKPYPEGEERQRINAAFDGLAAAVRECLKA